MPVSYDEAAKQLRKLYKEQFDLQDEMDRLSDKASSAESDDLAAQYNRQISAKKRQIRMYLEQDLVRFPPHHYARNLAALEEFHRVAPYDQSVFIMTKFPDGKDDPEKNKALEAVIAAVKAGIHEAGMTPRVATFGYQEMLWPNVELYLLGCSRGVAIVEDQYRAELNPNVALEWGWMKGMGKRVYFLMESKFAHERADWQGFLSKEFSWEAPDAGIKEAIAEWLKGKEEV
ncbi:MAG TPA: hypothetical protein VJ276_03920 [Thermoanaerobaculia bacterium]|nr:hypothetical protein [Thermoanaerobaculia bacterium]